MRSMKKFMITFLVLVCAMLGIFAACGSSDVTLSFETNGAPAMESVTVAEGETYELPTPAEWSGHAFEGWYLDSSFTGEPVKTVTVEEDTTFYAKWKTLSVLHLDLDGGSLDGDTTLYLDAGTNLYEAMENYVPQKADHQFGAWFSGDQELEPSAVMPQGELTLKARYKVKYTVEIYEQNLAPQEGYTHAEEDDVVGYEYAGTMFAPSVSLHGFRLVSNADTINSKEITSTPSENVFRLYFDRESYVVYYLSDYPVSDRDNEQQSNTYAYGTQIDVPIDLYSVQGFLFKGWSTTASGDVLYAYDADADTFNYADKAAEPAKLLVEDDITLHAVWASAYRDIFGGTDYLFLTGKVRDKETGTQAIYLSRAGILFGGDYDPEEQEFEFVDENGELLVNGKLFETEGTYAFYSDVRRSSSSVLYVQGKGLQENTQIFFDAYNGLTYSVTSAMPQQVSKGSYTFDEEGHILATFTSGPLAGEDLVIIVGTVTVDGKSTPAFQIRNEEEYEWGEITRMGVHDGSFVYYAVTVSLDGFGTATMTSGTNTTEYYYSREGDMIRLISSSGSVAGVLRHFVLNQRHYFELYDETSDHTYTSSTNSAETLTLDGCFSATYTNGANIQEGYYYTTESRLGTIVHFSTDMMSFSNERLFLTQETAGTVEGGEEGTPTTVYSFVEKPIGYAEYMYSDSEGAYYAPLIVFNDDAQTRNKITIYGYIPETKTYKKALIGTYTRENGLYVFTTETVCDDLEGVSMALLDYEKVKVIIFGTDVFTSTSMYGTSTYPVAYFTSVTMTDTNEPVSQYDAIYHEAENGSGKLTLVGLFCIYEADEKSAVVGQFSKSGNRLTVTPYAPAEGAPSAYYFELNNDAQTYVLLQGLLGTYSFYNITTGSRVSSETLTFDGKGNATYSYVEQEGEESVTKTITGTYAKKDGTENPTQYTFTGEGKTFTFILITISNSACYLVYNEALQGEYTHAIDGGTSETLVLDGFGLTGTYTDEGGNTFTGNYRTPEANVILLISGQYGVYIDLDKDGARTFTVRGGEYGEYLLFDNNGSRGEILHFDGYGHLTVYTIDADGQRQEIDAEGTYERNGNRFNIKYKNGNEAIDLYGTRGTMSISGQSIPAFFIEHMEVVRTYVNPEDWTVLVLDAYGDAIKFLEDGELEFGQYYLVSESLLYYSNSSGSDDCLYRYDNDKGTIERFHYTSRGYYTSDLEGLLFDEGGFMIAGADTLYYYEELANKDVLLYHQDFSAVEGTGDGQRNRYGFVCENIGKLGDSISFGTGDERKTYYANSGFEIRFNRTATDVTAENKFKFPVKVEQSKVEDGETVRVTVNAYLQALTFAPTGGDTFTVRGNAVLQLEDEAHTLIPYTCTVTRAVSDDEAKTVSFYVTIGTYRFTIVPDYHGDKIGVTEAQNFYTVTAMQTELTLLPSSYLQMYYMYLMFLGQGIRNTFGQVTLITEYNEQGEQQGDPYANGVFGQSSGMIESTGELVSLNKAPYEYDETTGLYTIEFTGKDERQYRMRFQPSTQFYQMFGVYSYDLLSYGQVDTFTTDDGYEVEIERVIASDVYRQGAVSMFTFKKDGEEIEATHSYLYQNTAYVSVEQNDEAVALTAVKYYIVKFAVDESVTQTVLPKYTGISVEEKTATRYYNAENEQIYADITADNEVILFSFGGYIYLGTDTVYDDATKTYTVTTHAEDQYTITVGDENKITIARVVAPAEDTEG